jgi:thiamine monophosphate synthase
VGGITPEREAEVIRRGAYGIATIRNFHLWEGVEPPTASTNPPSPETT